MNEREQIKGITRLLEETHGICGNFSGCTNRKCSQCYAEALYNAGYRKLPEDSVVLTREEWNKLMGDTYTSKEVDEIVAYKERMGKREVLRDILTKLADDFSGLDGMDVEYPLYKVKELARQFGVEVGE